MIAVTTLLEAAEGVMEAVAEEVTIDKAGTVDLVDYLIRAVTALLRTMQVEEEEHGIVMDSQVLAV
jgi:hypothetical protein